MPKILTITLTTLVIVLTPVSLAKENDAKSIWKGVLKECAASDLLGNKVLFLGLSNSSGPGSILRQRSKEEGNGYGFRWSLEDIEPSHDKWPQLFTKPPANLVACSGSSEKKTDVKAGLLLETIIAPLTGGLTEDLSRAKKTAVQVQSYAWDTLDEGPFVAKINSMSSDSAIRPDLNKPDRFVITRALKVKGIVADLEFTSADAATLQGKYKDQAPVKVGDVAFNVSWTGTGKTTLHLESPTEAYLAGELSKYSSIGFSGSTTRLRPIERLTSNLVVRDRP